MKNNIAKKIKNMAVIACLLPVFLVACGNNNDSFPYPSASNDIASKRHDWTSDELLAQDLYLNTTLPVLTLPDNAVISYTTHYGDEPAFVYFQINYGINYNKAQENIFDILSSVFGSPTINSEKLVWVARKTGEDFYTTIEADTSKGLLNCVPHSETWKGCKEYLSNYFSYFYNEKTFDELYPSFPDAIIDSPISFYSAGYLDKPYIVTFFSKYSLLQAYETKRIISNSGWQIYPWQKDGYVNSTVYTKKAVSGALLYDLNYLTRRQLVIHWNAGFENIDYSKL